MKILVIGGEGFIGSNLSATLERKGHKVSKRSRATGLDMTDLETVERTLVQEKPDAIFHCAAHVGSVHYVMVNAAYIIDDNSLMALNLYKAVSEICPKAHVINSLSNCAYPGDSDIQRESEFMLGEPHHSVYAYGSAKRFLYTLSKCYASQDQIRSSNFIVPNSFGPGDSGDPQHSHALSGMIMRMILAKRESAPRFEVWGSGNPIREWAYVDDVAEILSQAIDERFQNDFDDLSLVNVAQGHGSSILESAEAIKDAVGYLGALWYNTERADGALKKVMDNTQFRSLFPDFKFIDHAEAIRRTVAYFESTL